MTSQAPTQGPTDAGLTARVLSSEWQTIDTAPRDGRLILVRQKNGDEWAGTFCAYWVQDLGHWSYAVGRVVFDPVNWMPLPTPPTNPKGAA